MGALEEEIAAVEELISAYQSSCLPTNAFSHLVAINQPRTKRALPNLEAWFDLWWKIKKNYTPLGGSEWKRPKSFHSG
jgi:hypothetical protein